MTFNTIVQAAGAQITSLAVIVNAGKDFVMFCFVSQYLNPTDFTHHLLWDFTKSFKQTCSASLALTSFQTQFTIYIYLYI